MALPVLPGEGFEAELARRGRVVVGFVAEWCGFCARFDPIFRAAAARHPGLALALADISDDEADPRWDRHAIAVVPTVILFEGGAPRARLDGVLGRGIAPAELERFLAAADHL